MAAETVKKVEVVTERCKSCGLCVDVCSRKVLRIGEKANSKGYYYVEAADEAACVGCALCGVVCPDIALRIYREKK